MTQMHTIHTSTICHLTGLHVGCSIPSHHTESYSESHICAAKICVSDWDAAFRDGAGTEPPGICLWLPEQCLTTAAAGRNVGKGVEGVMSDGDKENERKRSGGEGGGLSQLLWISAVCETLVGRDETCSWNVWMSHYQSHGEIGS